MSISHWHIIRTQKTEPKKWKLEQDWNLQKPERIGSYFFKQIKTKIEPELNQEPNRYPNIKNIIYLPKIIN